MRERSIMIDIETMSTDKNALVLSIGAVAFDDDGFLNTYEKTRPQVFYGQVPWRDPDQVDRNRVVDASTLQWWDGQYKARRVLQEPQGSELNYVYGSMGSLITEFTTFVKSERSRGGFIIARPAAFDIAILCQMLRAYDIPQPWNYQAEKCMGGFLEACWRVGIPRTWKVKVESHPDPIAHHAGDDAIWQTALWVHYNHELWKIAHRTSQKGLFDSTAAIPTAHFGGTGAMAELAPAPDLESAP